MTDQELARAVAQAALALNAAITAATRAGLHVRLEADETQGYEDEWPRPVVRVAVMRPIDTEEG